MIAQNTRDRLIHQTTFAVFAVIDQIGANLPWRATVKGGSNCDVKLGRSRADLIAQTNIPPLEVIAQTGTRFTVNRIVR